MMQPAIFLDRDGTLVESRHYPTRPEQLVLYPGVAAELRRLQAAGFRLVVVTNQAGVAHGSIKPEQLEWMHAHLRAILHGEGVTLDAIYVCPHHPEGKIPELAIACDCRKPQPGLLHRAAADLALDLSGSWFVGDMLDDIEAGHRAGCRTILVDLGTESFSRQPIRWPAYVGRNTVHALQIIEAAAGVGPAVDLHYRPIGWPGRGARPCAPALTAYPHEMRVR